MQTPTHFEDKMEQAELRSAQLIDVEVSIFPFFLNMETEISSGNHAKKENTRKRHTPRIAAVLFPCLFQVKDNEWPHLDDIADNVYQTRERKVACINCFSERLPRLRPITMLSALETSNDEFCHRKGV